MPVDRTLNVPYNLPGTQSWGWISVYQRMSFERIIFINQPLTSGFANAIVSSLLYLDSEAQKPIYLYINSLGDPVEAGMAGITEGLMSVMSGLAIYDTIQHIKSEVYTICLGQAMGMATLLLAAGTKGKRASLPNATIGIMHPRAGSRGQASDIMIESQEILDKKQLKLEVLSQLTGQTVAKIEKDSDRMFYMTPTEALSYGLIDRVIEKQV
jgi:ATP-dependent Clp protease, protease subunit